ncbi:MAG: GNAT family N-acetyltransferase [Patescibacteria group bacterium]|nr:GNAT family N-acetyltransferase [Patescibacteria group bacterium]
MIKIRKFKKGDERKLSYLSRKCIVLINSKDITKKQTVILYKHFTPGQFIKDSKRFNIYVAELNGKVVGTATLDLTLNDNWGRAVFVNPNYHGKGIGRELMNRLESDAKKWGFRSVSLKASPFAVNFYKKLGYKKIKEIVGDVGSMTLMKKQL